MWRQKNGQSCNSTGFEGRERGQWANCCRWPLSWKDKEVPWSLKKECDSVTTLILLSEIKISLIHTSEPLCEMIRGYYLRYHQVGGHFNGSSGELTHGCPHQVLTRPQSQALSSIIHSGRWAQGWVLAQDHLIIKWDHWFQSHICNKIAQSLDSVLLSQCSIYQHFLSMAFSLLIASTKPNTLISLYYHVYYSCDLLLLLFS